MFNDIAHPKEPPAWIAVWPKRTQLLAIFSPTLRNLASRILSNLRDSDVSIQWTDTVMRARIGNNINTWTLVNGNWMRSCSCNAPGPHCIHDYASCVLVQTVFLREGWTDSLGRPKKSSPSTEIPEPQQSPHPVTKKATPPSTTASAKPRPVSFPTARESFFTPSSFNQPVLPIAAPPPEKQTAAITRPAAKLEVEIDMKATPGAVTVRFYRNVNDMRELLKMQQFLNLPVELRRPETLYDWSQNDVEFIKWCAVKLRAMQDARSLPYQSHYVILKHDVFSKWLERWSDQPDCFIERESQKPYHQSGMAKPTRIAVELVLDSDYSVTAIFRYVFQNGKQATLLDIARYIQDAPDKEDIRYALKAHKPPFDLGPFWKGNVRMRRDELETELPKLLNGHLELVTGKDVVMLTDRDRPVIVKADVHDGYFTVEATLDGRQIDLDSHAPIESTVKYQYGKIEIRLGKITGVDDIRTAVRQLQPAAFIQNGVCTMYETPQNAE
ncbi:MAG: hypothetical protein J6T46_07490 [Victivallales bacterium]|nr:hypothetical protein [Victivallales bacterium]